VSEANAFKHAANSGGLRILAGCTLQACIALVRFGQTKRTKKKFDGLEQNQMDMFENKWEG
jgi:hypothetical protein